jgi:autotransporter translocation and assembly factor TamB
VLSGSVVVHDAVLSKRIEANPDFFNFTGPGGGGALGTSGAVQTIPLRLDVDILAKSSLRIENNLASITASADLKLQGTYDRPLLFGRAEIERGNVLFEGNRYVVTPGGSIEFYNPQRIEPFFDVEAETRVRVAGSQEYRVTIGLSGTRNRLSPSLNSDPPLSQVDIMSLVFGQAVDVSDAELRALRPGAAQQSEEALLKQGMARLLASPISTPVGRVLGETFGIDTVTITPTLGAGSETDPLTPSARVDRKRISNRAT